MDGEGDHEATCFARDATKPIIAWKPHDIIGCSRIELGHFSAFVCSCEREMRLARVTRVHQHLGASGDKSKRHGDFTFNTHNDEPRPSSPTRPVPPSALYARF